MEQHKIQEVFTSNLRYLRKRNFRTQKELADKIGISRTSLASYEEARAMPPLEILLRICQVFDIKSIEDLAINELPYQK